MSGKRGNGEGSIYPYKNGFAAYARVTTPDGRKKRKYVYGKTRTEVHDKWIKLHAEAKELTVRDVRTWVNDLLEQCQCCAQGKDARREEPRCCAVGRCCDQVPSRRTVQDSRAVLRSALTNAMTEELISKNVAGLVKVRSARKVKRDPWSVEEARKFLEAASTARDPLYAAYVLILVLGFRRGEVLGLTWQNVNLDAGEVTVQLQLQRIQRRLVHDETKTEASTAVLPLPAVCVTALQVRRKEQEAAKQAAGELWTDSDFVFTTRYGTSIEPRNFNRSFADRTSKAGIRRIRLHDTRHTCGSLLAALDVHPRIAMQILRHSKIAVTMEIYTHVPSEATRKALRRLGKHLGKQDRK